MREIDRKLVAYIDKRLTGNGLAREAIDLGDPRLLFRLAAQACVGIREQGGGVYFTKRSCAGTGKMALLGFLKPF